MHILRTRFKKNIVTEFLPPARKTKKQKVIILCGGMPSIPPKKEFIEFLSQKGYWVFAPRYRGSWESGGEFLKDSPTKDILDVVDGILRGFKDLWTKESIMLDPEKIYVIGSSFGGPAALFASRDNRVDRSIALSPVIDWRIDSKVEPFDWLYSFVKDAFGEAYRVNRKNWNKLKSPRFYNPIDKIHTIPGEKIFVIATEDDAVVPINPTKKFIKKTHCAHKILKRGGHFGLSNASAPRIWKHIENFLK